MYILENGRMELSLDLAQKFMQMGMLTKGNLIIIKNVEKVNFNGKMVAFILENLMMIG